jgi:hypothetical protein
MHSRNVVIACIAILLVGALCLGCAVAGVTGRGSPFETGWRRSWPTPTSTATRTRIPRESIDFNATMIAATVQAAGGYLVTSTPLPVWPTVTPTPFDQISFLATINAQFAHATETAWAIATPTFTPSPTPRATPTPPFVLPPAGGILGVP